MNPLGLPWSQREKKPESKNASPQFLGVRTEAVLADAASEQSIHIEVRGVNTASGSYDLAYVEDASLGRYLDLLKLRHTAIYNAVYDEKNLERGRLRMTYVPQPGSRILIGPPGTSPNAHLQRSNGDRQIRAGNKPPTKETEVSLTYRRKPHE